MRSRSPSIPGPPPRCLTPIRVCPMPWSSRARRSTESARCSLARLHTPPFNQAAVISGLRVPVNLTSRESLRMFDLADIWATRTGHDVRLVSANDHVHSRGSAHYEGKALDFQSSDMDGLAETFRLAGSRALEGARALRPRARRGAGRRRRSRPCRARERPRSNLALWVYIVNFQPARGAIRTDRSYVAAHMSIN